MTEPIPAAFADGPFGSNLKRIHYTDVPEVRIIQLSNIGDQEWKDENIRYTTFEHLKSISRSEVHDGDIVIAKMMPAGKAILIPKNKEKAYVLSSDVVKFIPNKYLNRELLVYFINSEMFREQVYLEVQGITRARTSLTKLKSYIIPVPPKSEQDKILETLQSYHLLTDIIDFNQQSLKQLSKQLKKKVLDTAMRGKLVPQDPNDEPASILLAKIREEKQKLYEEGKLKKKDLQESVIYKSDDSSYYRKNLPNIPSSWYYGSLNDLLFVTDYRGKTPTKTDSGIRLITAKNIKSGYINLSPEEFISEQEYLSRNTRGEILKNDILLTTEAPLGNVAINTFNEKIAIAQRLVSLRPYGHSSSIFFSYILQSPLVQQQLKNLSTGSTVKGIRVLLLKKVMLPIPPLEEQKRIVSELDKIHSILG